MMPPRKPVPSDPAQEEELVVTVVRFKGSGETARKGIDAVSQAISAAFGGGTTTVIKHVNGRKSAQLGAGGTATPDDTIDTEPVPDTDETVEETEEQQAAPTGPKPAPKPRRPPKFDNKLAVTPFKAFAAERNPQTMDEKYLVACLWLQEDAGLTAYGASQVFTCFRAMGNWQIYDDFTQPMRIMKLKKSYYADTDKRGEWKLNDHGLDVARKIKHPQTA
jgi:hypothetical protein